MSFTTSKTRVGMMGELPYVSAPQQHYLDGQLCYNCYQMDIPNHIQCSLCRQIYYCSSQCQEEDWFQGPHELECRVFRRLPCNLMEEMKTDGDPMVQLDVRMACRMIVKRTRDQAENSTSGFPEGFSRRTVGDLLSHVDQVPISRVHAKWKLFEKTYKAHESFFANVTYDMFKGYLSVIFTNSFGIARSHVFIDDEWIGKGLYLQFSRFNHVCGKPDLIFFNEGRLLMMRPTNLQLEITKDTLDNLLIDYGTNGEADFTHNRRSSMLYGFYFDCECITCQDTISDQVKKRAVNKNCSYCNKALIAKKSKKGAVKSAYYVCLYCKKRFEAIAYSDYKRYRRFLKKISSKDFTVKNIEDLTNLYKLVEEEQNLPIRLHDKFNLPLFMLHQVFCKVLSVQCKFGHISVSDEQFDSFLIIVREFLVDDERFKFVANRWSALVLARCGALCDDKEKHALAADFYRKSRELWIRMTSPDFHIAVELKEKMEESILKETVKTSVPFQDAPFPPESFDRILLMPQCSNYGMRCFYGKAGNESYLNQLKTKQMRSLITACKLLKPGGKLLYATHSLRRKECSDQILALLKSQNNMMLLEQNQVFGDTSVFSEMSIPCNSMQLLDPRTFCKLHSSSTEHSKNTYTDAESGATKTANSCANSDTTKAIKRCDIIPWKRKKPNWDRDYSLYSTLNWTQNSDPLFLALLVKTM